MQNVQTLSADPAFWTGVASSVVAATILGIVAYIFRNSFAILSQQRAKSKKNSEAFVQALDKSSPYAPFAFGVAQGRGLRHFLTAAFFAYVGDILSMTYPANLLVYFISLAYVFFGLRWFFLIERKALEIINPKE
jgi:hypothetical protein